MLHRRQGTQQQRAPSKSFRDPSSSIMFHHDVIHEHRVSSLGSAESQDVLLVAQHIFDTEKFIIKHFTNHDIAADFINMLVDKDSL